MRGKKPLSVIQVVALRKLVKGTELHELPLNLGVNLMLRASHFLNLKVSDVLIESGSVKKEVRVRMKKTKKNDCESSSLQKFDLSHQEIPFETGNERTSSFGVLTITTRKNLFQSISIPESSKSG